MKKKCLRLLVVVVTMLMMVACGGKKASDDYGEIQWPKSDIAKLIPVPESNIGSILTEKADGFTIYIAKTTKEQYTAYVDACVEKGFNVDYSKSDTMYSAKNLDGFNLDIWYDGDEKTMRISLDAPEEDEPEEDESKPEEENTSEEENASEPETQPDESPSDETPDPEPEAEEPTESAGDGSIDPEFKEALDSYEAFMDEYVAFMKKYQESDDVVSMMSDYTEYMKKYTELTEKMEALEKDDMNAAEMAYYTEVMTRVSQKLIEASVTE